MVGTIFSNGASFTDLECDKLALWFECVFLKILNSNKIGLFLCWYELCINDRILINFNNKNRNKENEIH